MFARFARAAAFSALVSVGLAASAATIEVINLSPPGLGFNDPTPAAPVGGNPGTTLGEQRLNVFQRAADIWGSKLKSPVPIRIAAFFEPLFCTSTSAVLGSAGTNWVFRDFDNAPRAGTWYPAALSNKFAGEDLFPSSLPEDDADIVTFFNSALGEPGCLDGSGFYLGFDSNEGTLIDLQAVLLHELGHGLGFQALTSGTSGARIDDGTGPLPAVWERFMYDNAQRKSWLQMDNAQRATSARTARSLVWSGKRVNDWAWHALEPGSPELYVYGKGLNRAVMIGTASFGPALGKRGRKADEVVQVVDQADGRGLACVPLSAANAAAVAGKIALVDRGVCGFTVKVKNAQDAGAIAVIVADNAAGSPPANLGGADPTITIPAVRVTLDDGLAIKAAVAANGASAFLYADPSQLIGADDRHRAMLWTPNPYQSGSSVSHWEVLATPNLLMEPFINADLTTAVGAPDDLTLELLKDIGW